MWIPTLGRDSRAEANRGAPRMLRGGRGATETTSSLRESPALFLLAAACSVENLQDENDLQKP